MKNEGTLSIHLRPSDPEESSRVHRQKGCVTVSISDQGIGMNQEVKQNLFMPYFTTRKDEGGTGLGLANAHAIVSEIGGVIIVESKLGLGSTFRLVFPTQQSAPYQSRAAKFESVAELI
jgi:signal transduction histidine kinase